MKYLTEYCKSIGWKRFWFMLIGNIFLGLGVSIFKLSGLGNDPYNGMVMALAEQLGIAYSLLMVLCGLFIFIVQVIWGRNFIGIGTIFNAVFLGYIVSFFYYILSSYLPGPAALWQRIITVCIGVILGGFGLSLYQTANVGISPFDSLSLIMAKHFPKVSYFWHRMATDTFCAIICFLAGGIVGLGTLVSAFGFGPVINFFNKHFTEKLLKTGIGV